VKDDGARVRVLQANGADGQKVLGLQEEGVCRSGALDDEGRLVLFRDKNAPAELQLGAERRQRRPPLVEHRLEGLVFVLAVGQPHVDQAAPAQRERAQRRLVVFLDQDDVEHLQIFKGDLFERGGRLIQRFVQVFDEDGALVADALREVHARNVTKIQ
jgi:hypothetical protein